MTLTWIVLGIAFLIVLWLIGTYNGLVRLRNRAKEALSDIEVQLKRRLDLIPNLVESVKGYMAHESGVFQKVTDARARAMGATTPGEEAAGDNMLTGALKSLFAVAENYPDLKANQNFLNLQSELSDTENKIQASRRFYNTNVMELNNKIETFPTNFIAGPLGFTKMEFFDAEPAADKPVEVKF